MRIRFEQRLIILVFEYVNKIDKKNQTKQNALVIELTETFETSEKKMKN